MRSALFRKYAVPITALVAGTLFVSGTVAVYSSYRETKAYSIDLQREKALSAATRIEQYVADIHNQIGWTSHRSADPDSGNSLESRRFAYQILLRQVPAITEVAWIDASGREQLRVSRLTMVVDRAGADVSNEPRFKEAMQRKTWFSPVYFRDETEPYMTIARPAGGDRGGVTVAEVNLKFVWDVVSRIRIGKAGIAYVIGSSGGLIAHPDMILVLQRTDLSKLEQVRALQGPEENAVTVARNLAGDEVLTANARITTLDWVVFVEQPLSEAFAPLYDSVLRSALLMVAGLVLAVMASLYLARRMVSPIRTLADAVQEFAEGRLQKRINVRTGDELQTLAERFNTMAAQLQEYHASLEQKVEMRTRELEVANRHKSQFLANMSHELRTPLNAIIGVTEMLHEDARDLKREDELEPLERVMRAARHLLALINDILDLSKIEAGKMELRLETFPVAPLIRDVVDTIEPLAKGNGNKLVLNCPLDIGTMRADATRLRQTLLNLASNANKFTERGTVSVAAKRELRNGREWISIAVRDTGIGITDSQKERLFQEFVQADISTTRKYGGTGLGLAISRRFCQMMGGDIEVESEAGIGSCFTVRLPADISDAVNVSVECKREATTREARRSDSPLVLVVDDDRSVRDLTERYLTREGFSVVTASTAQEGLNLARELKPDAMTLDVLLPDLNGWTVLAAIKGDPTLADIPVVLITVIDEKNRGYSLGAAEYIVKPVDRLRLTDVLRRICGSTARHVLVVDDDEEMRRGLSLALQADGWIATEAANGRLALATLAVKLPDVILLDLVMPDMDGFDFLVELRSHRQWQDIPVVVITAKDLTRQDRERLSGGVRRIIQKNASEIDELLREVCRVARAHERGTARMTNRGVEA